MIARGVEELSANCAADGMHNHYRTAGTVYTPVACDLMSISPKLENSTPEGDWAIRTISMRIQLEVLRQLMDVCEYQLKFVVRGRRISKRFAISFHGRRLRPAR